MADVGNIVQESLHNQYKLLRACEEKDAEIERLRSALRNLVDGPHGEFGSHMERREYADALEQARAVLEKT